MEESSSNSKSKDSHFNESDIKTLEKTLYKMNSDFQNAIKSDAQEQKHGIEIEKTISKVEQIIFEFDENFSKHATKFSELFGCSAYILNFVIKIQETIMNVTNSEIYCKILKDIFSNTEAKIQYFENNFLCNYTTLTAKYKSVLSSQLLSRGNTANICNIKIFKECQNINADAESLNINFLLEMERQLLEIDNYLCNMNNRFETINKIKSDLIQINNKLNAEKDNKKNIELQHLTIKKLSTHVKNFSSQLIEAQNEKEEALEELTACNQELDNTRNEHRVYKQDIKNISKDIESNLDMQLEIKKQQLSATGDNNYQDDEDLRNLEKLKILHLREQEKGTNILNEMLRKIMGLKSKSSYLLSEIRRINGEINTLNKQILVVTKLKHDGENNYEANSLKITEKINRLTVKQEKIQCEYNSLISTALNQYCVFTNALNMILKSQNSLKHVSVNNSEQIKQYWKNVKQIQVKWINYENHLKRIQCTEKQQTSILLNWQNVLKDNIANYKNLLKINDRMKIDSQMVKLNKEFQEFQKKQATILTYLEYLIIETNFQNTFTENLQHIIPGFISDFKIKIEFDQIVDSLIHKLKTFKHKSNLLEIDFSNLRNVYTNINTEEVERKLQEFETNLKHLYDQFEDLDKEKNLLNNLHISYVNFNNQKVQELKSHYEKILANCQIEINSLTSNLQVSQQKLNNLKDAKQELSTQVNILKSEKKYVVETLKSEHAKLQENITVVLEDKNVLLAKLEHITLDLIKIKSLKHKSNYTTKLAEIQETRNKIKHVIKLIESLEENLNKELTASCSKLSNAKESFNENNGKLTGEMRIKYKLSSDLQNEVSNLKRRLQSVLNLKHNIEKSSHLLITKVVELKSKNAMSIQKYKEKLESINRTNNSETKYSSDIQVIELKMKDHEQIVKNQIVQITDLNSKLIETIRQIKSIKQEKHTLKSQLTNIQTHYMNLQKIYQNIIHFELNFAEKIERHILHEHNINKNIQKYFKYRLDNIKNNIGTLSEYESELSLYLFVEKQRSEFLKHRLLDFHVIKENVTELCIEFWFQITTFSSTNNDKKLIMESIDTLKQKETELETYLQNLYDEKEQVDKNYQFAIIEQETLSIISEQVKTKEKTNNDMKNQYGDWQIECLNCQKRILENHPNKNNAIVESFILWENVINQGNLIKSQDEYIQLKEKYNEELEIIYENNNKLSSDIFELKQEIENKNRIIFDRENEIAKLKEQYLEELLKIKLLEKEIESKKSLSVIELYNADNKIEEQKENLMRIKTDITEAEKVINSLKSQLWNTVHKYVDLEYENDKLRQQLDSYQHTNAEDIINSLKLYLWITANKYKKIKYKSEKLSVLLQNVTNINESHCQDLDNHFEHELCIKCYIIPVIVLILLLFICVYSFHPSRTINYNKYTNRY